MNYKYENCKNQLELALYYTEKFNLPIFPVHHLVNKSCSCRIQNCSNVAKHPSCLKGFKDASTRREDVIKYWGQNKNANIGLATGKISNIIVIDIDPRNGGLESLELLEDSIGDLGNTVESQTGGGGLHKFYKFPQHILVKSKNNWMPGIDIKSDGGYVILPKSNHKSGQHYEWDSSKHIEDFEIADIPSKLLSLITDKKSKTVTNSISHTINKGSRNTQLTKIAGILRRQGLNKEELFNCLYKINISKCCPPLEQDEVLTICKSISNYSVDNTIFEWEKPSPLNNISFESNNFPEFALPDVLKCAINEVSLFSKVDKSAPITIALSTVAVAIGKKAKIEEKKGLEHYPAMFFAAIAKSGERKSDTVKNIIKPLRDWEISKKDEYKELKIRIQAENSVSETIINELRKKLKDERKATFDRKKITDRIEEEMTNIQEFPPEPRIFSSDITPENLFQKMYERDGAFAVISGEGRDAIDNIIGKYAGNNRTGDGIYLAAISGDTISRDRVGSEKEESKTIHNPCLNVCIFVQPDKYYQAATDKRLRESGALARIWPVMVPSRVGSRIETMEESGLKLDLIEPFYNAINKILNSNNHLDGNNKSIPHIATLSVQAKEARRLFFNEVEKLQAEGNEYEDVRDLASKSISTTCKLALILHIVENPTVLEKDRTEISLETWRNAETISRFYLKQAINILRSADEERDYFKAQRLLFWLRDKNIKSFRIPDIIKYCPSIMRKKSILESHCKVLLKEGWLKKEGNISSNKKPIYYVHPKLADLANLAIYEVSK